jgi:exosortase
MRSLHAPRLLWPAATATLVVLLYAPTWRWLAVRWWYDPNFGYAFLVLPAAFVLVWLRRDRLARVARQPGAPGLFLLGAAVAAHVFALSRGSYLASALTIPLAAAGLIWLLAGLPALRQLWFPVLFLLFMVPFSWSETADGRLQAVTARLAAGVLGLLGIKTGLLGAEISLPGSTFEVGAACSGLRSTMALLTVGTVLAFLLGGPRWGKALLVLAIAPIALASNLVRIVSLLLVALWFGDRVAMDYYHYPAGILLFLCATALFLLLARLLGCTRQTASI